MYLGLQQKQQLSQKLIMTPQLQMAVNLLQLSRLELTETIRQELEENPALEEAGEPSFENNPSPGDEEVPADTNLADDAAVEDKIIEAIRREYRQDSSAYRGTVSREFENRDYPDFEYYTAARQTLTDHLLWQLMMTNPTPEEEIIGSMIAGSLDRNGYLTVTVQERIGVRA